MAQSLNYRTPQPPASPQPHRPPTIASLICAGATGLLLLFGLHEDLGIFRIAVVALMPILQITGIVTGIQVLCRERRPAAVGLCANVLLGLGLASPFIQIVDELLWFLW